VLATKNKGYPFLKSYQGGVLLSVYIQPRSAKTTIVGPFGDPPLLKVKVASPPVDGAANTELIQFLSKQFHCAKSTIQIIRGQHSRQKDFLFNECDLEKMTQHLNALLP